MFFVSTCGFPELLLMNLMSPHILVVDITTETSAHSSVLPLLKRALYAAVPEVIQAKVK